ncbi:hypothetical protein FACS1894199_10710 [Bacteroidia bacterium]|nr:hypothetical protein FACS1894199_10710 [Bacteroidia bacterium]
MPANFAQKGEYIYNERNQLKKFFDKGEYVVVKSFKMPHIINRIAYTFFRPSKAKRSYEYALKILEKGIQTPIPIAYIEEKKGGLLTRSYYISTFVSYPSLLRELSFFPLNEVKELVESFARFTASIHNKQVLHLDYSPGNIMYEKTNDGYHFCLVDINRMKFGDIDLKTACFNLRRLCRSEDTIAYLARIYAKNREFNEDECVMLTLHYHKKFWEKHPQRNKTSTTK